jgi:hypothetical protein
LESSRHSFWARHFEPGTSAQSSRTPIAFTTGDTIGIPGAVRELPVTPQRLKQLMRERGITPA